MKIGPKYKIARRLDAPVFEKTQTQKFTMSLARRSKGKSRRPAQKTDFGSQMLEKQKARYTYLLTEKQFSNYVKKALAKKGVKTINALFESLELRLDNAVFRLGLVPTRTFARQLVSHGHILVNGKRVDIPSYQLSLGDIVTIRPASLNKSLFVNLDERLKNHRVPSWVKFDIGKKEAVIDGVPKAEASDLLFDLNSVVEFYSR